MLLGVVGFILSTLIICLSQSIEQFMVMRIFQGAGMCFVAAVGYAAIQEAFTEKVAIQVTAMMLNVAMLAPLIGPLTGAAVLAVASWKMIFIAIAGLALISGVGLYYAMPETSPKKQASLSPLSLWKSYRTVLRNHTFMVGVLAAGVMWMPLLAWIGESPVFIMEAAQGTTWDYGVWQIPVMGAVIVGSVAVAALAERFSVRRILMISAGLCIVGLLISLVLSQIFSVSYQGAACGLVVYALGLGFGSAPIYRVVLFSSNSLMGLASAVYGLINFMLFAISLETCKFVYQRWSLQGFVFTNVVLGLLFILLLTLFYRGYQSTSTP
jgi:DHA1 family multidrug/chloramphenicol efflux transport protein-like MFS transporter